MEDFINSDPALGSDIDISLDDELSDAADNNATAESTSPSKQNSNTSKDSSNNNNEGDEEPGAPYLPHLKTSMIQVVLNINSELIKLCQEYQNKSLMDDPLLMLYQMRLQSNIAYLASVADHYMDPTKSIPDLGPLPNPTLPSCQGTTIADKLAHARNIYGTYVKAWTGRQLELSRRAKSKLKEEERARYNNIDRENLHEHVEELLKKDHVVHDQAADESVTPQNYKPFPPFRLPANIQLPPGLQRFEFEQGNKN